MTFQRSVSDLNKNFICRKRVADIFFLVSFDVDVNEHVLGLLDERVLQLCSFTGPFKWFLFNHDVFHFSNLRRKLFNQGSTLRFLTYCCRFVLFVVLVFDSLAKIRPVRV